jgi:hypothetical protein
MGGACVTGLPEPMGGRCITPCPNPAATNGACPANYGCYQLMNDPGHYCIPDSQDCTNLNNFTTLQMGQNCGTNPMTTCATGLDCIGICSKTCTGAPGQGDCPTGYACATFNFAMGGPMSYCAPPVNEGQSCSGVKACTSGPCLTSAGTDLCYRDCANNPNTCNNAQTCTAIVLSNGTVDVCVPPGVPPNPVDAGAINDSGGSSDSAMSQPDATEAVDAGGGVDAGSGADASPTCTCDMTFGCDPHCECDPDCMCACDQTYGCDQGCACDPDCKKTSKSCGCTTATTIPAGEKGMADESTLLVLGLFLLGLPRLLGTRRFMR